MADIDIYKAKLPQDNTNLYRFRDGVIEPLVDISYEETEYANPLTFETKQAQIAKDTKIKIEPIQDLHGFDKPWVGGAGKNICYWVSGNNQVIANCKNGVTYTFSMYVITDTGCNLKKNNSSGDTIITITGISGNRISGSFTADEDFDLYLNGYSQFGDKAEKLQLEVGQTATSYAPYENICPISGHDEIDILGCGKNLIDTNSVTQGKDINSSGEIVNASDTHYVTDYIPVIEARTLHQNLTGNWAAIGNAFYDKNKNFLSFLSGEYLISHNLNFTVPENAKYVRCTITDPINAKQLEYGTSETSYEPYQESNNLSIDLPSTVYGGVLDLESGELVVDRVIQKLKDQTISMTETQTASEKRARWTPNPAVKISELREMVAISNVLIGTIARETYYDAEKFDYALSGDTSGHYLSAYCSTLQTSTDWINFAITNDVEICYELSTPYTLHLTPHQLSLLKSQNTITTSNYTQVKVTYRNGVFATLEELSDTAQDIYDEISGDTTTVSGNPLNFVTKEKQKSKSTIIDLEPIQDLHGFTKPWVGGAGKNKLDITSAGKQGTASAITLTITDVQLRIQVDGSTYSGANIEFPNLTNGTYYLSFGYAVTDGVACIQGFNSVNTKIFDTGQKTASGSLADIPITISDGYLKLILFSSWGTGTGDVTYSNVMLANQSGLSYEPYTNICPITGRSEVNVDGCGKNLLYCPYNDSSVERNGLTFTVNDDGSILVDGTANADTTFKLNDTTVAKAHYKNLAGSQIIGSGCPAGGSSITYYLNFQGFEVSGNGINDTGSGTRVINVSDISTFSIVQVYIVIKNGTKMDNLTFRPMIRSASDTNGEFKPYTPSNQLTISLGTTVYGGRLDVEKGELVVDRGLFIINGSESLAWGFTNNSNRQIAYAQISTLFTLIDYSAEAQVNTIFNMFKSIKSASVGNAYIENGWMNMVFVTGYFSTSSEVNTWLASNNLQIIAKLATPTTIQLTPHQIQLLKGINNISTTGTTITITFKNGSVAHLDDLPENVFTDDEKEKLNSIDTLAVTLDLLTHTLVITQDII